MYFLSFTLLFLAITSVLYGTTTIWPTDEYGSAVSNVQLTEIKKVRFTGSGAIGGVGRGSAIADDLISSPPE